MKQAMLRTSAALLAAAVLSSVPAAAEQSGKEHKHDHSHTHDHGHDHGERSVYKGYFEDSAVAERPLADWEGDWQSVYPYLADGTLDPVMAHKADHGEKQCKSCVRAEVPKLHEQGIKCSKDDEKAATLGRPRSPCHYQHSTIKSYSSNGCSLQ